MKKNTYIDTYNQITSKSDVSDCNKFLTVLDTNYEKYKYFHRLAKSIEEKFVYDFYEIHHSDLELTINLIPESINDISEIVSTLQDNVNMTDSRDKLFIVNITNDIEGIEISISCDEPEEKLIPHIYRNMTVI